MASRDNSRYEHPSRHWAKEVAMVVDPQLADVWAFAWSAEPADTETGDEGVPIEVLLRMAYLQGYRDALEEPKRGELFERLGVEVPLKRRRTPAKAKKAALPPDNSVT